MILTISVYYREKEQIKFSQMKNIGQSLAESIYKAFTVPMGSEFITLVASVWRCKQSLANGETNLDVRVES